MFTLQVPGNENALSMPTHNVARRDAAVLGQRVPASSFLDFREKDNSFFRKGTRPLCCICAPAAAAAADKSETR
jgi:hypothetical protein